MRVLVVEDETKMAGLLRRGLTEEGYAVDIAANGTDGLWAATEYDYDAIILDLMLPDLSGLEVCRQLRSRGRWAPVLMLTARDGVADRVAGLDAGADDYLVKPFAFSELFARLRALVRRGPSERPPELVVGDLVLDPAARSVARGGVARRPDGQGIRPARIPDAATLALCSAGRGSWSTSGTSPTRAIPTLSTCTSATCVTRSTGRLAGARSRRSAAPATGCARPRAGDALDPCAARPRLRRARRGDGGRARGDRLPAPRGGPPGGRRRRAGDPGGGVINQPVTGDTIDIGPSDVGDIFAQIMSADGRVVARRRDSRATSSRLPTSRRPAGSPSARPSSRRAASHSCRACSPRVSPTARSSSSVWPSTTSARRWTGCWASSSWSPRSPPHWPRWSAGWSRRRAPTR